MHDLSTIRRLNAEAFADAIANLRRQGRDVVATYAGSTLMSIESFSIREEALAAVQAPTESPDEHRTLYVGYQPATTFPPIEPHPDTGEQQLSSTCDGSGNCALCSRDGEHEETPPQVIVLKIPVGELFGFPVDPREQLRAGV